MKNAESGMHENAKTILLFSTSYNVRQCRMYYFISYHL